LLDDFETQLAGHLTPLGRRFAEARIATQRGLARASTRVNGESKPMLDQFGTSEPLWVLLGHSS